MDEDNVSAESAESSQKTVEKGEEIKEESDDISFNSDILKKAGSLEFSVIYLFFLFLF